MEAQDQAYVVALLFSFVAVGIDYHLGKTHPERVRKLFISKNLPVIEVEPPKFYELIDSALFAVVVACMVELIWKNSIHESINTSLAASVVTIMGIGAYWFLAWLLRRMDAERRLNESSTVGDSSRSFEILLSVGSVLGCIVVWGIGFALMKL